MSLGKCKNVVDLALLVSIRLTNLKAQETVTWYFYSYVALEEGEWVETRQPYSWRWLRWYVVKYCWSMSLIVNVEVWALFGYRLWRIAKFQVNQIKHDFQ